MRVTNSMLMSNYLRWLNSGLERMGVLQEQISSGKKILRSSDDPIGTNRAMGARSTLAKLKQYGNNVTQAKEILNQTETTISEMNSLLQRAYELAVSASNASNGTDEYNAIATEIDQIKEQLVLSANATFSDKYIFGGDNTSIKPFEVKEVNGENVLFYNGYNLNELDNPENADLLAKLKSQRITYNIGFGATMDVTYNGIEVIGSGENNIYAILDRFSKALKDQDSETISESVELLKSKQTAIVTMRSEIGGKTNRLEMFAERLENDQYNYEKMLDDTEGVDTAAAMIELTSQQTVYEAALASGVRLIMPTLADFLN